MKTVLTTVYENVDQVDAEFIAHARTDIPALIKEVERLRKLEAACMKNTHRSPEIAEALKEATYCEHSGVKIDD